eukprot:m.23790 g.23790  ORF g.23790 m.23790 type:complete len:723 (+) comp7538_c0_seq2:63-2231(+)
MDAFWAYMKNMPPPGKSEEADLTQTAQDRATLHDAKKTIIFLRGLILTVSGVFVALLYFLIHAGVEYIQEFREESYKESLKTSGATSASLNHIGLMASFVLPAVFFVIFQPASGGSGIPEIISYLNGVKPPRITHPFTGVSKTVGMILAVGGGLALGPEGPAIHIGAIVAANVLYGIRALSHQQRLRDETRVSQALVHLTNDNNERLFVACGVAAGIAVAFRAPIGGVFFALEEAISFFSSELIVQGYLVCIIAYFVAIMLEQNSNQINIAQFVEFQLNNKCTHTYDAISLAVFIILGFLGGSFGSLFNICSAKLHRLRQQYISKSGWKRLLEVAVIILITSLAITIPPAFTDCTEIETLRPRLAGPNNATSCVPDKLLEYFMLSNRSKEETSENAEELLKRIGLWQSHCSDNEYNQLASLIQNSGHGTVRILFEKGTQNLFDVKALVIFFMLYFFLVLITAGISVPQGLVLPMLILGGTIGRAVGIVVNKFHWHPDLDPGFTAQVGAAAFWCGSGRITATIAIIVLEITGEFSFLPAIGLAVIVSKRVGDVIHESLYHELIHIKEIPFLSEELGEKLGNKTALEIAQQPPLTLSETETIDSIRTSLDSSDAVDFIVVNDKTSDHSTIGVVRRKQLQALVDESQQDSIDLRAACSQHQMQVVLGSASALQAFELFRGMGLRTLVVVDSKFQYIGIITRKALLLASHPPHGSHEDDDVALQTF